MRAYRFYFLNLRSIAGVEILEAESDESALQAAEALFREKGAAFNGFELWELDRRIGRRLTKTVDH
jgi:hypothetical protein